MTLCFCIDDGLGIAFNRRRQSKDKALTERLCSHTAGGRILLKEYSARLFEGKSGVVVTDAFEGAADGDFVFVELEEPTKYMRAADRVIIYRWNRLYPSDVKLEATPDKLGFRLDGTAEFVGNSHEKITEEIWRK